MVSIDDGGGWVKVISFRVIWLKGIVSDVIWFKGTVSDAPGCCPVAHQAVVLQSRVRIRRLPSPQLIANLLVGCHPGMALGCGLPSVRGNRGKNHENEPLVPQKHTKKKKQFQTLSSLRGEFQRFFSKARTSVLRSF
jgi:hypothetical protein